MHGDLSETPVPALTVLVVAGKMAQNFPVRTQQWTADVSGINTDFLSSLYADRLMVVATEVGALGTIQSAKWALFPSPSHFT